MSSKDQNIENPKSYQAQEYFSCSSSLIDEKSSHTGSIFTLRTLQVGFAFLFIAVLSSVVVLFEQQKQLTTKSKDFEMLEQRFEQLLMFQQKQEQTTSYFSPDLVTALLVRVVTLEKTSQTYESNFNTINNELSELSSETSELDSEYEQLNIDLSSIRTQLSESSKKIKALVDSSIPIGTILAFSFDSNYPSEFLVCDGSQVSKIDYPDLYAKIGDSFGSATAANNFVLPNLGRRVIVGYGGDSTIYLENTIGALGGVESVALTIDQMPSHYHSTLSLHSAVSTSEVGSGNFNAASSAFGLHFGDFLKTDSKGGDQAHTNLQPSIVLVYAIKAK